MGMIACYQCISDQQLNSLKNFNGDSEELLEELEDWGEEPELLLDIDKNVGRTPIFVLTGVSACEPIDNDPLSEAVVGVRSLEDIEDFIAYTEKTRVAEILSALEAFDIDGAMEKFSMEACKKAELYPNNLGLMMI